MKLWLRSTNTRLLFVLKHLVVFTLIAVVSLNTLAQSIPPLPAMSQQGSPNLQNEVIGENSAVDQQGEIDADESLSPIMPQQGEERTAKLPGMDLQYLGASFGWTGMLIAEKHTPVWIDLTSELGIVSGAVTLRFQQDSSQNAEVTTQFTTRPGVTTRVEIPIAVPSSCSSIEVVVQDGRRVASIRYGESSNAVGPMPDIVKGFLPVLLVDVAGLQDSFLLGSRASMKVSGTDPTKLAGDEAVLSRTFPLLRRTADLPTSWIAYESVGLVVITESKLASADPRAREALRAWVHAGGQLMLFVEGAGTQWEQLALPTDQQSPVDLDDQRIVTLPRNWAASAGTSDLFAVSEASGEGSLLVRSITINEHGKGAGWRGVFDPVSKAQPSFVAAIGPAGLGIVTLVGLDPASFATWFKRSARIDFERRLLLQGPFVNIVGDTSAFVGSTGYGSWTVDRSTHSLTQALTTVIQVQSLGPGLLLAMGAVLVVLIAAVGPMGRWAVRRTVGLSRSWLFAIIAVVLSTGVAALLPQLVRSGKSSVGFITVIDAMCDQQGTPTKAVSSSVMGMFSGRGSKLSIEDASAPSNTQDTEANGTSGSFVRGVAPREYEYSWQSDETIFGDPLRLLLSTPTMGSLREHKGAATNISQWNFRAFSSNNASRSVAALPSCLLSLDGEATRKGKHVVARFSLIGLREGEKVEHVDVFHQRVSAESSITGDVDQSPAKDGAAAGSVQFSGPPKSQTLASYSDYWTKPYNDAPPRMFSTQHPWHVSAGPQLVPAVQRVSSYSFGTCLLRAYALDSYVAGGDYALVVVQTRSKDSPLQTDRDTSSTLTGYRIYRLLVPLKDEIKAALSQANPSATEELTTSTLQVEAPK